MPDRRAGKMSQERITNLPDFFSNRTIHLLKYGMTCLFQHDYNDCVVLDGKPDNITNGILVNRNKKQIRQLQQ